MAYKKVGWKDYPSTDTPINATNLDHMDAGILENAQTIGDKTKISGIGDGTVAGAIVANKSAIDANAEAIAQNTQSLTNIVDSRNMYTFLSCAKMNTISLLYTDAITINANIWTTLLNIPETPITNIHSSASDASGNSYMLRLTVDGNLQIYSNKTVITSYITGNITYL